MPIRKIFTVIAVLLGVFITMRVFGIKLTDVWHGANKTLNEASSDFKDLAKGKTHETLANEYKRQGERIQDLKVPEGEDGTLHKELSAERRRFMEQRSKALKTHSENILHGDVDTLKRHHQKSVNAAGGSASQ